MGFEDSIRLIYGEDFSDAQIRRYKRAGKEFQRIFSVKPDFFFTAPGRTELCGNHTDHNNGLILAAGVNLDAIAAVSENNSGFIRVFSNTFNSLFEIQLSSLEFNKREEGTTEALMRGVAFKAADSGYSVRGFNAYIDSLVPVGSGLSSSASFEVLLVTIINWLFNAGNIDEIEQAKIALYAENNYFGKPCGLMDQITCAVGGILKIDFEVPDKPGIEKINFRFKKYQLCIVKTGGNHSDLTKHYSLIPEEMRLTASFFNKNVCREITLPQFLGSIPELRKSIGDRAILRCYHFLEENRRVDRAVSALKNNNISEYLESINESGSSSFRYLQNCYIPEDFENQNIPLAIALTESYNAGNGAGRIHGGGFAGTIQAYILKERFGEYRRYMEKIYGKGSVIPLRIREYGTLNLDSVV